MQLVRTSNYGGVQVGSDRVPGYGEVHGMTLLTVALRLACWTEKPRFQPKPLPRARLVSYGGEQQMGNASHVHHREIPRLLGVNLCFVDAMPHTRRGDLQTPGATLEPNTRAGAARRK